MRTFFQVDMGHRPETVGFLPLHLQSRFIINFKTSTHISYRQYQALEKWLKIKWNELPVDAKEAFFNRIVLFIKTQTVALGEKSTNFSFKVNLSFTSNTFQSDIYI